MVPYAAIDTNMDKNVPSQTKGDPVIRENSNSGKQNILGKDKIMEEKGKKMENHVIKSLATNPDILVRAVQDQMQKQFKVEVSKMKAFKAKIIASDNMTSSFREQYTLFKEYAQELINQNLGTTVRIDVQQEPNPESLTRIFRMVYVCLGALKQGFRTYGREILGLDGCFMSVEAESKTSWCWFLNLLEDDLGIEANFNYTFISDRQKGLIQAIANVFPSAEHRYHVRHIHENMKSQFKGDVYKEMLWNVAKATSEGDFKKKIGRAKCDILINNIYEVFNRQLVDGRDQLIITCLEYIIEYLMKRIVVVQKVTAKTVGPLTPSVIKMFDDIKKRLLIGRQPKKRNKSNDEIASQSASSGDGSSHAGAKNVSGQAVGSRKVSGQAVGAKNISGQADSARNGPIAGPASGSQRKTKKLMDL
ncbi:hypothetical protein Tco_1214930 [Tanacetum coccineum]